MMFRVVATLTVCAIALAGCEQPQPCLASAFRPPFGQHLRSPVLPHKEPRRPAQANHLSSFLTSEFGEQLF